MVLYLTVNTVSVGVTAKSQWMESDETDQCELDLVRGTMTSPTDMDRVERGES